MIKQPRYSLTNEGLGRLDEEYIFECPIYGLLVNIPNARLGQSGELKIQKGYEWDFGSGPAVDTPAVVYASLGHDVLYDMIGRELLQKKHRKTADVWFRDLLKRAGMGWFRRSYMYMAVRYGYPLTQVFK